MIKAALAEVRREMPAFGGPALLAGLAATAALLALMLISPAAGVAALLVVFAFFLLALASFPARVAWQEGAAWRHGQTRRRESVAQAVNAAAAVFFLICAAASTAWALGAHLEAAAVTFALCLVAVAVLGHRFREAGWVEEVRRGYGHVGLVPKLALATVWLAVMAPEAISAYDHDAIRSGDVWEPAIRTIVALVPFGWLLWDSGVLRASRNEPSPPQPRGA